MARAASMKVVALEPLPNDPMLVRVRVGARGGRVAATLSRPRCDELGLRCDIAWTAALERRVLALAAQDSARDAGLRRLGRSAVSAHILQQTLARAGHSESAVRAAVAELREAGWLNDAAYAEHRAQKLATGVPLAAQAIAARLEDEGVDPSIAAKAVAKAVPEAPTRALADEARTARKRGVRLTTMAGRLARRGFDEETVLAALRAAGYAVDEE